MSDSQDVDRWKADLLRAGWIEARLNVWVDLTGAQFRGPYGAWCELQAQIAATQRTLPPQEQP